MLGKDVTFDMVLGLLKRTLLGWFEYVNMSRPEIIACMTALLETINKLHFEGKHLDERLDEISFLD